jgi:hypothetical protein
MRAIDIDPELLQRSTAAALHASQQATVHFDAEMVGDVPKLMETLTRTGPYAYAIKPEINADGTIEIPLETEREAIGEWYALVRGASDLLPGAWPLLELRGEWYTFHEQITRACAKGSDVVHETETIALLPVTTGDGITGELVWFRTPKSMLGVGEVPDASTATGLEPRKHALRNHERYVDALQRADVDGIVDVFNAAGQSAVRDYVADTGTLTLLRDEAAHRAYYGAFFERFEVLAVDLLHRVVQEWYVFAELALDVRVRTGDDAGEVRTFRTAEFCILANDDRFIARIGHGTDPAARLL